MRRFVAWLLLLGALAFVVLRFVVPNLPDRPGSGPPERARPLAPRANGAKDAGKRPLREVAPVAAAGEPYTVELMDPPASTYGGAAPAGSDASYAAIVAALRRPGVVYDPALSRAAAELAYQQSILGGLVPQDIVDFLLRSAGAVDRTVVQGFTATSGDGAGVARQRIEEMLGAEHSPGPVRIGVGEVWIPGAERPRILGVLLSRREVEVAPAPRRVEPGETWVLSGVLPRDHQAPSALVLRPDGHLDEVPVHTVDRRFRVTVDAGATAGTLVVSVGASGPFGHTTLVQLPVEVGQALPATLTTALPPDESGVRGVEAAEQLALALLNADRARFGLPALARDPRLDAIARGHSADMRAHGFFGHRSPTTGGPQDRVAAARYRAASLAENIAVEESLHGAEVNLFASLGHRRNILSTDVTHVGIGVAARETEGRREWHLTQLFARPVAVLDEGAEADRLRAAIDAGRRAAGVAALTPDRGLDQVARTHARAAADGQLDGLARRALDGAGEAGLLRGQGQVVIQRTADVGAFEVPAEALGASYRRIGVGLVQRADDLQGMVGVVLLFSGE
jgi:uncharacterized protein YkwD